MRRKERYIRNAAFISAALTATVDILRQRSEYQNRGEELTLQNLDWSRTVGRTALGAAVGAGVGYLYYQYRVGAESAEPFDPDRYLHRILTREHLRNDPGYLNRMLYYRDRTSSRLAEVFNGLLAGYPEKAGSLYKRTANVSDYDADIILAFKKYSYATLQEMFADAYEKIKGEFGSEAIITKHRRSIGILFESGNDQFPIDIVLGREINDYRTDRRLNLYVNPTWFWQQGSRFKVDITQQREITSGQPAAREVIRLLKIYRNIYAPDLPTPLIEQCVTDALSSAKYNTDCSITENLLNSMDWLARKLRQVNVWDIANSNNDLNKKLTESKRFAISSLLQKDIIRIEGDPRYLKEIFEL